MQKRFIGEGPAIEVSDAEWMDLENQAAAELTSEQSDRPIEFALRSGERSGWRAAEPGLQVIRLVFRQSRRISRILLRFSEKVDTRTQEFVLRWAPDRNQPFREIVRQQWTFSPQGSNIELEDYQVNLDAAGVLELIVNPDIGGKEAFASLDELRIA